MNTFEIQKISYKGAGLTAIVKCTIDEDKKGRGRVRVLSTTQLEFKKEGKELKIAEIWEKNQFLTL